MRKSRKKVKNTRTTTKEYLYSDHWEQVKKQYASEDEVCEICGIKHWHTMKNGTKKYNRVFVFHHKNYNSVGAEQRTDLLRICKRCHDECHRILRMKEDCEMVKELKETVRKYFEYIPTERKKK